MVILQGETLAVLTRMDGSDYDLLNSSLDVLIEMVQGSCTGNQNAIGTADMCGVRVLTPSL